MPGQVKNIHAGEGLPSSHTDSWMTAFMELDCCNGQSQKPYNLTLAFLM